jgi:glycosyltransferase involved in cell wall biosynthesis
MKIAINVQTILKDKMEGLGWFSYESIKRIIQQHPEHQFLLIFSKGIVPEFLSFDNVETVNIGPPFYRPLALYLKFEYLLPYYLKKHKIDLFISTDGISSVKIKTKQLLVIHDLNFEENSQWINKSFANYYKKYFPKWARNANRIATVSEYSKNDIHKKYQIPLNKIDVVYNGANQEYSKISESEQENIKSEYTNGSDYFIFVGSLHPRKNIARLFLSFDIFKKTDTQNIKLLIVGSRFFWNKEIQNAYNSLQYKNDIVFTGHLSVDILKKLMSSALALTYISLFEGFGIPLVEAMYSETAIISSNTSCLPEIAKDAALYVNPYQTEEIAKAMTEISNNKSLRTELIAKGQKQKTKFSWQQTADKLWSAIEKTIQE